MKFIRLPLGQPAPIDADCIRVEEQPRAIYKLTASALCIGPNESESVSIVDGPAFRSSKQAEAMGIAWAANVGVDRLFVSRGTLADPLQLLEIDKPL